jgi:hypothetical protein
MEHTKEIGLNSVSVTENKSDNIVKMLRFSIRFYASKESTLDSRNNMISFLLFGIKYILLDFFLTFKVLLH